MEQDSSGTYQASLPESFHGFSMWLARNLDKKDFAALVENATSDWEQPLLIPGNGRWMIMGMLHENRYREEVCPEEQV